jgi:hypothetical protein
MSIASVAEATPRFHSFDFSAINSISPLISDMTPSATFMIGRMNPDVMSATLTVAPEARGAKDMPESTLQGQIINSRST